MWKKWKQVELEGVIQAAYIDNIPECRGDRLHTGWAVVRDPFVEFCYAWQRIPEKPNKRLVAPCSWMYSSNLSTYTLPQLAGQSARSVCVGKLKVPYCKSYFNSFAIIPGDLVINAFADHPEIELPIHVKMFVYSRARTHITYDLGDLDRGSLFFFSIFWVAGRRRSECRGPGGTATFSASCKFSRATTVADSSVSQSLAGCLPPHPK